MIKVSNIICCERVLVDQQSKRASYINIMEGLIFAQFPAMVSPVTIAITLQRDVTDPEIIEGSCSFRMGKDLLLEGPANGSFQGALSTRLIINVGRLTIPKPGNIDLQFIQEGRKVASWKMSASGMAPPK